MSVHEFIALYFGLVMLALGLVAVTRQLSRLRETLRRNGIYHDKDKPWEGP